MSLYTGLNGGMLKQRSGLITRAATRLDLTINYVLTWSASPSPAKSDIMFPIPAAAIVDIPRVTPMVVSMYSP